MLDPKKILLWPVRFIDSLMDRICAVLGAVLLAQFPQFLVLYLQRLGGHTDEARRNLDGYREIAKDVGQSLYQYIQHLLASRDPVVFKTGQKAWGDFERYNTLANSLKELQEAPAFKKFFIFIKDIDFDIARNTLANYTPGLPLSWEGAAYAATGIVLGMAAYFGLTRLILLIVKKLRTGKKKPQAPAMAPPPGPAGWPPDNQF
jgi:hypothetical protein